MAIDWGHKRFGLAFGNEESGLILPAAKPCYTKSIWDMLAAEIQARNIQKIVVGLPSNFHGGDTIVTTQIRDFLVQLHVRFPQQTIYTINERGSSQQAKASLQGFGDNHSINHLAAVDILERWVERNEKKQPKTGS